MVPDPRCYYCTCYPRVSQKYIYPPLLLPPEQMGMNDTLFLLLCISSSQYLGGSTDQLQVKWLQESSRKQLCTLLLFCYVKKALPPTKTRRVGGDSQERPSYAAITNNSPNLSGPNIKHFCSFFLFSLSHLHTCN